MFIWRTGTNTSVLVRVCVCQHIACQKTVFGSVMTLSVSCWFKKIIVWYDFGANELSVDDRDEVNIAGFFLILSCQCVQLLRCL